MSCRAGHATTGYGVVCLRKRCHMVTKPWVSMMVTCCRSIGEHGKTVLAILVGHVLGAVVDVLLFHRGVRLECRHRRGQLLLTGEQGRHVLLAKLVGSGFDLVGLRLDGRL